MQKLKFSDGLKKLKIKESLLFSLFYFFCFFGKFQVILFLIVAHISLIATYNDKAIKKQDVADKG